APIVRLSVRHLCSAYLLIHIIHLFFINAPALTAIYTLSLHDALPILNSLSSRPKSIRAAACATLASILRCESTTPYARQCGASRSEEHTSELQSHLNLVCRLLLEKKQQNRTQHILNVSHTT